MSLFAEATALNNQAIVALVEGDDTFAIKSMTDSIKLLKLELAKPVTATFADMISASHIGDFKTVEIPDCQSSDHHHEIFNQAIHLPCLGDGSHLVVQVYSAAVIFNLALAHHRQGIRGNTTCRQKAVKLYDMVLRILDDSLIDFRTAVMVKLATINNLAQIQFATGDYQKARTGLSYLPGFIRHARVDVLADPQVQRLLMTVLMIREPKVAAAA